MTAVFLHGENPASCRLSQILHLKQLCTKTKWPVWIPKTVNGYVGRSYVCHRCYVQRSVLQTHEYSPFFVGLTLGSVTSNIGCYYRPVHTKLGLTSNAGQFYIGSKRQSRSQLLRRLVRVNFFAPPSRSEKCKNVLKKPEDCNTNHDTQFFKLIMIQS